MEFLKALILGIIQGITEWLPISSTGHMILVDEILKLNVSSNFMELFLIIIQFGSILAVIVIYFKDLVPFEVKGGFRLDKEKINMWVKIVIASIPAGIVGVLWSDELNSLFFNSKVVAIMLILVGVAFLVIEKWNKNKSPKVNSIADITYKSAFIIGVFQLVAAVFPGTSRSGSTIIGALLLGIARPVAAQFTFFLAVPIMAGASLLKLIKFEGSFTSTELGILIVGMVSAFVVSIVCIKFLMSYIRKHNFNVFGWYRIVLGILVLFLLR
ncbi:undecaprenyl-diphosphate phosphatase [Clostridium intestinale]|uniref:Undecaprenyl-diphosphatase n=1 Tax=Clostridium intestinale DSM 6191 TaxID=1121320 RepID=A0A1M5W6G9_9CLOT|nr:undecaprenyl-diphosphate phosphatase [Clostridium intestinale]SHH83112.1 undecaprenyl-diphosphatase [Clostridium intestinale DSM 6191]